MRMLWLLAAVALFVAPQSIQADAVTVLQAQDGLQMMAAEEGDGGGDKGEEAKKDRKSRSYADKIRGRDDKKAAKKPEKKPKYKKWDEVLKDAEAHEGLFKVHTKREDLIFEIQKDQLDKPYLAVMSLSKGIGARFVLGGLPLGGFEALMFDFHRVEDHVQVRQLNTKFRSTDDPAIDHAIDLAYGNSVLFQIPIESENEKTGAVLLNMNDAFLSDISDMGQFLTLVLSKPVRLDNKKTVYRKIKAFPKNVEIEVLLTYSPGDRRGLDLPSVPDNRFIEIGVHYSLHGLPEDPMKPRFADDRIGYFTTPYKDFTRDAKEDFFVYPINRWRLEKKDPGADLSEPKQPIVFYLDHTIPKQYRKYVAEGIEMWQKAFEGAGFKNAIIAKEAPDDKDFDPEDARYNTIRWIISDEPSFGAIGPSRVDPRTGEILDADILMEQNMIAGFRKTFRRYAGPEAILETDPMLQFLKDPSIDPEAADRMELLRKTIGFCDIGLGMSLGIDFLHLALLNDGTIEGGMDVPPGFVGEAIRHVTAHEVGHTLGLRHNFKSSISTPYEKLNDRYAIEQIGLTGSVMDYSPPNVSRDRSRQGYYYGPSVGTYDVWAVKWGYSEVPGNLSPWKEAKELDAVASEAHLPQHAYGTDEDTYPAGALDPVSNIWDLSDQPLLWAANHLGLCRDIMTGGKLEDRVVGAGGNYVPLRYAVQTLLIQEYIAITKAIKYVGGQYTARSHRGDSGGMLPLKPVLLEEQRKALDFLIKNAFSANAFTVSPDILNKLADDKYWSWQNNLFEYGRRFDFPLVNWTGTLQNAVLAQLLQPMLLQRVLDAQYKVNNPFPLAELFGSLTSAIWYNNMVPSGKTAVMQRNLQRIYLNYLIQMTVRPYPGTPHEAVALARLHLTRLLPRIEQSYRTAGLSDEANAHLVESKARIDRALDAKLESSF